jgi:DNA modification methylase
MPLAVTAPRSKKLTNPEANKLQPQDRAIHEWYRFVLSFPPHLVRDYADKFGCESGHIVLDPFAGTGTTLVEAKKAGFAAFGIENHPMGHFACTVKTDWGVEPGRLVEAAEGVAEAAAKALNLRRTPRTALAFYEEPIRPKGNLKTLSPDEADLLLKDSISPVPLHKALVLREQIDRVAPARVRAHLRLALAKAVVADASNLHFGPEVGLGDIREDAPLIECWLNRVYAMANDLRSVTGLRAPTRVFREDSRSPERVLAPKSIDFVITSPPYPNEKDYTRTTRLETVLLGFMKTKDDLRALKQGLIRSNTRNVYYDDDDERWVDQFESIQHVAAEIEGRRLALGKTSGFERLYHRVTRHYFGGMAQHLAHLRPLLKPGARLAYVVGDQASYFRVLIRTGQFLAEIAEHLGYKVEGIDLFRTRLATATRAALREEVVRLRWPTKVRRHA